MQRSCFSLAAARCAVVLLFSAALLTGATLLTDRTAALGAEKAPTTNKAAAKESPFAERPNVIVFLVDDMGWIDCEPYGSRYYETPNMQRLAERSMRFTSAYACPLCSPTRASILSGQYSARHGTTSASGHRPPQPPDHEFLPQTGPPNRAVLQPESKNYLDPAQYTLAEALHDAGYRTAHIGKWHLGLTEPYWPEKQGFDTAFHGHPDPGPPSYFSPYGYRAGTITDGPPGEYITDRVTDESLAFIEANRDRPFYLSLWHAAVHGPWGHKEEYTRQFADKKDPRGKQANPIMASMLKSVDQSLGRVMDKLDELKIADRTVIIFFSDNGGNTHSNTPEDAKALAAVKSERIADWRKWAGPLPPTNNEPLRMGKGTLYEGGVRVPMMVLWPGTVKPGTTSDEVVASIDLYPTILDITGTAANPKQKIDGISIVPALKQTAPLDRKAVFNYFPHGGPGKPPGVTVRSGDWKLIRWFETGPQYPDKFELYNLKDDLGETTNLAAKMPERVRELDGLIDGFLKDTGALYPRPNPAYKGTPGDTGDLLLGWVPKSIEATRTDGGIRLTGSGRSPFIANVRLRGPASKHTGPLVLRLSARSAAGGEGRVQWRTGDQEMFPDKGQTVSFTLPAGDAWQDVAVTLPIEKSLAHVRLYLPADEKPVDLESIRLEEKPAGNAAGEVLLTWKFSNVPRRNK